ncbi:MAG: hypothetical protein K2L12_05675 [Clostridia bacterium]|nr:hypothetical protein [Clostridia bacterium]
MKIDINNAGCEFVKAILKLYRSERYSREREILASKMLTSALDAGSHITELGVCPESHEDGIARKAMEELSRAMFVLKVMRDDKIYSQRRVEPIISLGSTVKQLIELYYNDESKLPPVQLPQSAAPQIEQKSTVPDLGGFDEIYTGKY